MSACYAWPRPPLHRPRSVVACHALHEAYNDLPRQLRSGLCPREGLGTLPRKTPGAPQLIPCEREVGRSKTAGRTSPRIPRAHMRSPTNSTSYGPARRGAALLCLGLSRRGAMRTCGERLGSGGGGRGRMGATHNGPPFMRPSESDELRSSVRQVGLCPCQGMERCPLSTCETVCFSIQTLRL